MVVGGEVSGYVPGTVRGGSVAYPALTMSFRGEGVWRYLPTRGASSRRVESGIASGRVIKANFRADAHSQVRS